MDTGWLVRLAWRDGSSARDERFAGEDAARTGFAATQKRENARIGWVVTLAECVDGVWTIVETARIAMPGPVNLRGIRHAATGAGVTLQAPLPVHGFRAANGRFAALDDL